jgi:DNA-binding IclR family transcriptional regulator
MKKTYRVTGDLPCHETAPGSTFVAELDADHEARLLERGSVCVVKDAPKPDPVSKKKEQ